MKKIKIAIIILAAVLIAAGAVFLIAFNAKKENDSKTKSEADKLIMYQFDDDETTKVEITNDGGSFVCEYVSGEGWQLSNSEEFELNDSTIGSIAAQMSNLKAIKTIEDTDISKYGLDNPTKVTCYTGDTPHAVLIGDPSPTREHYYAMKENDDTIYLIAFSTGFVLDAEKDSLKQTYIYQYSSYDVNHFAIWDGKQEDKNLRFSMNKDEEDVWSMDKPVSDAEVNYVEIDEFLTDSAKDQIYSFVEEDCTEADYSKYGFDNPLYVFEISTPEKSKTVIFGAEKEANEVYGLFVETGQVVTFNLTELSMLNDNTLDMIESDVYAADIASVTEVSITINGEEILMDFSGGEDAYKINDINISEKGEDAKKAFVKLYDSFNNAQYETEDKASTPSGEAEISIKYTTQDGLVTRIDYIPIENSDMYYAMKNDEYTGFKVASVMIDGITSAYEELQETIK